MSQRHKGKVQVHAVVRYDRYLDVEFDATQSISVVEVLPTAEEAKAEVDRLNELNGGKSCQYFWVPTRYWPDGRRAGVPTSDDE